MRQDEAPESLWRVIELDAVIRQVWSTGLLSRPRTGTGNWKRKTSRKWTL
jgi:hypothetical protein